MIRSEEARTADSYPRIPQLTSLLLTAILTACCNSTVANRTHTTRSQEQQHTRVFIPVDAEPTYHALDGYNPKWQQQIRAGIEMARAFWGSFGPTHVWIAGQEQGGKVTAAAKDAFLSDYCSWRIAGTQRTLEECRDHATKRFFHVALRGAAEAYLSWVDEFEQPEAELVFINVHKWFFERDSIPDPTLRGIHEYTHVFQKAFQETPTWMMEGGAVFAEAWIPWMERRCDFEFFSERMARLMKGAHRIDESDLSIADMEDIDSAPNKTRRYHRELAYDAGAWAIAFLVHKSDSKSVTTFRDKFYPMVNELGWEQALCRYTGVESKEQFYEEFRTLMVAPQQSQALMLRQIKP